MVGSFGALLASAGLLISGILMLSQHLAIGTLSIILALIAALCARWQRLRHVGHFCLGSGMGRSEFDEPPVTPDFGDPKDLLTPPNASPCPICKKYQSEPKS